MGIITLRRRTDGVALVTVLIMVFIIMAIISNITIQNYRTIRRLTNQTVQDQAVAILHGTMDFARAGLATSGATSKIDALTDIWAQPIPQTEMMNDIFISGYLLDEQGKFNINDLVAQGMINQNVLKQFTALLNYLNIPASMANSIAYYMAAPQNQESIMTQYTSGNPAYRPAGKPLVDLSELLLVKGMQPTWVFKLNQYVTVIPQEIKPDPNNKQDKDMPPPATPTDSGSVKVNINTASPEVIAAKSGMPLAVAQRIVTIRYTTPFKSVGEIQDFLSKNGITANSGSSGEGQSFNPDTLAVESRYFTLHALVTHGDYQFKWIAMLLRQSRNGQWPTVVWQHPE
jgi:general secretion pathway protein K